MEYFIYAIIFLIGTFFGSFFTLAVYRIPKREDILVKHSYCPNCNHKLGILDLFPIFSYIFLKGRCRYCSKKIRPRYLILEIMTGIAFVLIAISLNLNFYNFDIKQFICLTFTLLYVSILFIIAGIDKENFDINIPTIYVGLCFEVIYMIYACTLNHVNVYQYVIYAMLFILILVLNIISKKIFMEEKYCIKVSLLILYIVIYGGSILYYLTAILTLFQIIMHKCIYKNNRFPIGFYLCTSNIVAIILENIFLSFII